jgi:NAD(P)-dependent dehydrogenase (short-subunit alcohol dehydrogenase family)
MSPGLLIFSMFVVTTIWAVGPRYNLSKHERQRKVFMSPHNPPRIQGQTILVTGSSRGIGFYTAKGLAEMGAHVIIVSHNQDHCEEAVENIRQSVGEGSARYFEADLSRQADIHQLAEQVQSEYKRLDVLVNNVGIWNAGYQETDDGIELTFALNHLSYFLLSGLLLELLQGSSHARIVNVASDAHQGVDQIHFEDISFENKFRPFPAYAQSKLANIMFTYQLAERLEGTGITANVLHPGAVASKLYRDFGILEPLILLWIRLTGKTAQEGAETPIYLASSPEVAQVNGQYFADQEPKRSSEASYDRAAWKRLWTLSEELTGFTYPI